MSRRTERLSPPAKKCARKCVSCHPGQRRSETSPGSSNPRPRTYRRTERRSYSRSAEAGGPSRRSTSARRTVQLQYALATELRIPFRRTEALPLRSRIRPTQPSRSFRQAPAQPVPSTSSPGRFHTVAGWPSDGKRLFFWAFTTDGSDKLWKLDLATGEHGPIGEIKAMIGGPLSPDGRSVVVHDGELPYWRIRSLSDGATISVPGSSENQVVLCWDLDGKSLFIRDIRATFRVSRLHLADGRVETWRDFAPADAAGVFGDAGVVWLPGPVRSPTPTTASSPSLSRRGAEVAGSARTLGSERPADSPPWGTASA